MNRSAIKVRDFGRFARASWITGFWKLIGNMVALPTSLSEIRDNCRYKDRRLASALLFPKKYHSTGTIDVGRIASRPSRMLFMVKELDMEDE